jgi:hypothetical protein
MREFKLAIAFAVAFAGVGQALAAVASCPGDDGCAQDVITKVTQVLPAPPSNPASAPSAAFSDATLTRNVKYSVELKHYPNPEPFSEVDITIETAVTGNGSSTAPIVSVSTATLGGPTGPVLSNTSPGCTRSSDTKFSCQFVFSTPFNTDGQTISFDVIVKTPTSVTNPNDPQLQIKTLASWKEPNGEIETDPTGSLLTSTNLTAPDPFVAETVLVAPGTVTTGTTVGVLSCTSASDPNRWINILKVPTAAGSVSVNLNPFTGAPSSANYFSTLAIPGQKFGEGIPWYSRDAASKLLVITQKRHKCTIGSGQGTVKDALIGLATKTYYKPDHVVYWRNTTPPNSILKNPPPGYGLDPVFLPVPLCLVSGGPYLGEPCILYEYIDAGRNLIRVFYANENGKYATD